VAWSSEAFTHFRFSTGDETKWLIASRDSVIGSFYGWAQRPVECSSSSETAAYSAQFVFSDAPEHPWVTLLVHSDEVENGFVYGEGSCCWLGSPADGHSYNVMHHNGANVFIGNFTGVCS
jgi:hypothetical protein